MLFAFVTQILAWASIAATLVLSTLFISHLWGSTWEPRHHCAAYPSTREKRGIRVP